MKESKIAAERLKKVLLGDKIKSYEGFVRVLRGDLYALLQCYMTLDRQDVDVNFSTDDDGAYRIVIEARATHIKSPQTLSQPF